MVLTGWFVLALVMFFLAVIGCTLLILTTWIIGRRFGGARDEPVYVDIKALLPDRLIINCSLVLCLLIEGATLVWDTISPRHFPILIRWPIVVLVIAAVCTSGGRLFRLYLQTAQNYGLTGGKRLSDSHGHVSLVSSTPAGHSGHTAPSRPGGHQHG